MHNPLVPTPIVDRNGKPTTVHRKAASAPGSKPLIPKIAAQTEAKRLADAARERLIDAGFKNQGNLNPPNLSKNLDTLAKQSPETLGLLVEHIRAAGDDERRLWLEMLHYGYQHRVDYREPNVDYGALYRKCMAVNPVIALFTARNKQYSPTSLAKTILSDAEGMVDGDYAADPYMKLKAAIIISGINSFDSQYTPNAFDDDRHADDIEYIAQNFNEVQKNVDKLIALRGVNGGSIRQNLEYRGAPALIEGVL